MITFINRASGSAKDRLQRKTKNSDMLGQTKGIEGDLRDTVHANLLLALHNPLGKYQGILQGKP
jgi:hypothetical protein